jgi:ankyrin repeat protein
MFGFKQNKTLGDTNDLVNRVSSNDYHGAKSFIESRGYNERELNSIADCYSNNLLHIAVMNCNHEMVSYFLDRGLSYTRQNRFKQSAWDLAVLSKDNEILERLVSFRAKQENPSTVRLSELSSENESLKTKNRELKRLSSGLETTNIDLEKKYSLRSREVVVLQTENNDLKTSNKRLREEVSEVKLDNKRLREEVVVLTDKNQKLKTSVETLMNNSKK